MLPLWWKSLLLCWLNCWRKEKLQQCLVSSQCLSWCFVPWRLSINNRRDGRRLETGQKEESWSKYSPCFSSTITFVSSHSNWICHVISIAETNVFLLTLTAVAGDRRLWFPFGIWGLHGHLCFLTVTWGSFPCWVLQLVLFVVLLPLYHPGGTAWSPPGGKLSCGREQKLASMLPSPGLLEVWREIFDSYTLSQNFL